MTARGLRIVPGRPADAGGRQGSTGPDGTGRHQTVPGDPATGTAGTVPTAPAEGTVTGPDAPAEGTVTVPTAPAEESVTLAAALLRLAPTAEERRWTTAAICASGDPDRLFVTGAAQREAAKLCRHCPVQMECLADALDNQVEFGVWGGLTERQRRALLKRRPDVASWRDVLERAKVGATRGRVAS